jgi:hypothetical protein
VEPRPPARRRRCTLCRLLRTAAARRQSKPNGKPAKLTLGPVDVSGVEPATAPSLESLGAPLTLAGARQLAAEIHRQRAMGRDIVADMKATKHQRRVAIREGVANTFAAAVMEFVEQHAKPKTRRWRTSARMLGLRYAPDGSGPTVIKGGLAERWSDRPITKIHPHDPGQQPEREPGSKAHIADAGQTQGGIICVRMPSALGADVSESVRAYLARRPQKREYSRGSQII